VGAGDGSPVGVSLGYWQDRDPMEALATAALADRYGYRDLWLGEMATFDVFALATAVGTSTSAIRLVLGPLPPSVRDPAGMAMGVASVAALTGRPVDIAIGASSPVVVERWHGRPYARTADQLRDAAAALRVLLAGSAPAPKGYRLRLPPVAATLTVAAFGPASVRVAGECADRMVINMCTPQQAARLRVRLDAATAAAGRERIPLAAWVPAAVDSTDQGIEQLRRGLVSYVAQPGYGEMFAEAGFADVVELARSGAHPADVLSAVPVELIEAVGVVGSAAACRTRITEHVAAGVDEVVIVPVTAGDPAGERTLSALAPVP